MSEGIDVELGAPIRLLIIARLPYTPRTTEFLAIARIYSKVYGIDFHAIAKALEESDMVNAIVQALGRVERRTKGVGIILDERIAGKKLGINVKVL